jgi:four helix bundle protein
MQDYTKLKVWEKAHVLTVQIYHATQAFPREEIYGMSSQLRRSASSIPMNIAEGCGRSGKADKTRFFEIAFGSACEAEYQLLLAHDLKYIGQDTYRKLAGDMSEVKRMLAALINKLKTDN